MAAFFGKLKAAEKYQLQEIEALAGGYRTELRQLIAEAASTLPPLQSDQKIDEVAQIQVRILASGLGLDQHAIDPYLPAMRSPRNSLGESQGPTMQP